ncbi:hypothetical protein CPB84DRAFT_1229275 [Gymnopilus junonius]|uniref:Uncharacterized protein n=1 Tax=Gymnopilus junonius TaxID=109634 RepID=A0A9P5NVH4_GYMJU|nr:hypothetical protein CPB84DRAFT_1229275 [Gymnopilus junonius]
MNTSDPSTLEALKKLQRENRELISKNNAFMEDIIRAQDRELQPIKDQNAAFQLESQEDEVDRMDKKVLKRRIKDLCDTVAQLNEELHTCERLLEEINSFRKPCPELPPKILHLIFERTVPPHSLTMPCCGPCPNSLWSEVQKQKITLMNVCRA